MSQQSTETYATNTFGMIAFAISDASYAVDMIDDALPWRTRSSALRVHSFVALDLHPTTVCRRGIHKHPAIAGPGVAESVLATGVNFMQQAKGRTTQIEGTNTKFVVAIVMRENFLFLKWW